MSQPSSASRMSDHLDALDALRFVAASWVALSHGALPLKQLFSNDVLKFASAAFASSFNGSAAVMVFFIISGLCIHRPRTHVESLPTAAFLVRRYVRIGVPLVSVLIVAYSIGVVAVDALNAVLWSVYAEIVYYSIYPLLFHAARRYGWSNIIIVSSLCSAGLTLAHLDYTNVQQFKELTWLWGLPAWLAGCKIAENLGRGEPTRIPGSLAAWRLAAWGLGAAALFFNNHSPIRIGHPVSLLLFSVFAYFWLSRELQGPTWGWRWLQDMGAASYTLYLVHNIVIKELDVPGSFPQNPLGIFLLWAAIAIVTYLFYRLVEAPSHRLARWAAKRIVAAAGVAPLATPRPNSGEEEPGFPPHANRLRSPST